MEHYNIGRLLQAPFLQVAAEQVAERTNKQDALLLLAALEETDRTVVVKNDQDYKVDVLKINLDKAWEVSLGVGSHRGDAYIPMGVQRNYAAHKAVAVEVYLVPEELTRGKVKTSGLGGQTGVAVLVDSLCSTSNLT